MKPFCIFEKVKSPKQIVIDLAHDAYHIGNVLWSLKSYKEPGAMITKLSPEQRKVLTTLKSDDIKGDKVPATDWEKEFGIAGEKSDHLSTSCKRDKKGIG